MSWPCCPRPIAPAGHLRRGRAAHRRQQAPPQAAATPAAHPPGPYQISVQVDADSEGLLVLAESWHPNWHVTVDGQAG